MKMIINGKFIKIWKLTVSLGLFSSLIEVTETQDALS